jgi:hypothetical protein
MCREQVYTLIIPIFPVISRIISLYSVCDMVRVAGDRLEQIMVWQSGIENGAEVKIQRCTIREIRIPREPSSQLDGERRSYESCWWQLTFGAFPFYLGLRGRGCCTEDDAYSYTRSGYALTFLSAVKSVIFELLRTYHDNGQWTNKRFFKFMRRESLWPLKDVVLRSMHHRQVLCKARSSYIPCFRAPTN